MRMTILLLLWLADTAAFAQDYPSKPVVIVVPAAAGVPMTLIAKKTTPAANFHEFLSYLKQNKEKISYANAGIGSASYLCGILFMSTIQTEFTQIPYKGTGPAMNDLVGGQVDFMC